MYHNCASLCSHRERREGETTTDIPHFPINYRNLNQHAADYLFRPNSQVDVGLRRLRRWNFGNEKF